MCEDKHDPHVYNYSFYNFFRIIVAYTGEPLVKVNVVPFKIGPHSVVFSIIVDSY